MDLDPELAALGALGGFFVLRTGAPPHRPLPTLAQAYGSALADTPTPAEASALSDTSAPAGVPAPAEAPADAYADPMTFRVGKVARSLGAPEVRVAASLAHQGLAARLCSVALGCAALYGQVPDLDPRLLHWDPDGTAPDDLWLREVRALPVASLDTVVREQHLAPLAAAIEVRYRVSARLLWGNAGSALAGSVRMLDRWARASGRTDVVERARALAAELLAQPGLSGTLDPATGRRRSCCLYYRLPAGGLCGDCCFDRPPGRE